DNEYLLGGTWKGTAWFGCRTDPQAIAVPGAHKLRPVVTVLKEEDRDWAIRLLLEGRKIVPHRAVSSIQSRPLPYCEDRRRVFRAGSSLKNLRYQIDQRSLTTHLGKLQ